MSVDLAELALSVDANGFVKADRTMANFNKTASNTEKQADKIAKSADRMAKSVNIAERAIDILKGTFAALAVSISVSTITEYSDAWTNVSNTLRGVVDSQQELIKTQTKVISLAKDTSSNLEATAGLYSAITRSVSDLGVSQDRVLGVTKTINNLFLAGGKSAASAAGAITQLNQGLAAGALRGDEFNSVAEGAPRILDAVAKHLNMTRGDLRNFAATGGITAEILIASLESYSAEAQKAADITRRTFSQNSELAKTFALEWVGASDAITTFSSTAGQALVVVANNLDLLTNAAIGFAVVAGAKLIAAMAEKTAAMIASTAATNAQIAAENSAAVAAQRRAVVEQESAAASLNKARTESIAATAAVNQARANGTATQSIAALVVAQNQQAIAQARLTGSIELYTAATVAANAANARLAASSSTVAATGALAGATRGLGAALALVGGPAGLAIIAAGSIAYLALKSTDAEKRLDKLRSAAEGSGTAIQNLGEAGKKNRMNVVSDEIAAATDQMTRLQNLLKQTEGSGFSSKSIDRVRADIELLQNEIKNLNAEMASLSGTSEELSQSFDTLSAKQLSTALYQLGQDLDANYQKYAESSKSIADMNKQLAKEIDLVGNTSKETEILYDLNHKNIIANDEQTASLLANAKALDKANAKLQDRADLMQSMNDIIAEVENSMPDFTAALQAAFEGPGESGGNIVERTFGKASDINALSKEVDNFGGTWSRTGSIIADAFGGVADSLNDYIKQMEEIAEKQRSAEVSIPKTAAEEIELEKIKIKLSQQHASATISGYGKMAGAAASMFKEQSKGRKALNNAEKVFTAIEIALAAKKAAANALTAITSAFSAPFPVNFAAGAAMIAIMAGLGVFKGGSSGGGAPTAKEIQETQGTGTVLGDSAAKSESINKAFDAYKDIAVDQLAELRGIRNSLQGLSAGIISLASSLVRRGKFSGQQVDGLGTTTNSPTGALGAIEKAFHGIGMDKVAAAFFGSTTKKLIDTGLKIGSAQLGDIVAGDINAFYYNTVQTTKKKYFGLSKSSKTKDQLTGADSAFVDQVSQIFGFLGDSVSESLSALGVDAASAIENFQVNIGKISFKDLSGDEIQKELESIFGQQADLLAEFVLPQITQYQKMGEGAFETLTRVAKEQAVFNDALDNMGLSLGSLSNIMRIDVAQSIITLMGGLDEFSSKTSAYFNAFFSEDEKIKMLGDSLSEAFGGLGLQVPTTDRAFRDIVEALDLTSQSGQQMFASLMELVPGLDQYTKAIEKSYQAQLSAAKTLAGEGLDALKLSISAEKTLSQSRLDSAKTALSVAQSERDAASARSDAAEKSLNASFNAEISNIEKIRDERLSALDVELSTAQDAQKANQDAVSNAQKALEDALSAEQKMREDSLNAQADSYRKVAADAQAYAQSLRSLSDSLRSSIVSMGVDSIESTMARRSATQAKIDQALTAARGGNFENAMNLDLSALQNNEGLFSTRAERDFDIAVTQNKLEELAKLADGQATIEEKAYAAAERSANALDRQSQSLSSIDKNILTVAEATANLAAAQSAAGGDAAIIAGIEEQIAAEKINATNQADKLQSQLDALLGNTDAVLTLDDSIKQFLNAKEALAIADAQLETAKTAMAVAQSMYDAEIAAYDEIIAQQTALYNAALGIDNSIKSVDAAIGMLSESLANYANLSQKQQQDLASIANQQTVSAAQKSATDSALTDEITRLRTENKELQEKMANSLKTIADNSTSSLNLERLNA